MLGISSGGIMSSDNAAKGKNAAREVAVATPEPVKKAATGKADVFDTMGNDLLKEKVAEAEKENTQAQQASDTSKKTVLEKAEKNLAQTEQKNAAPELAAEQALRMEAVAARDAAILQLQSLSTNADLLKQLQQCQSQGQAATLAVELVGQQLSDEEMAALSAYNHHDLLQGKILSPESHLETRGVSPQAGKMGNFVSVLWQMVYDQFNRGEVKVGGDTAATSSGPQVAGASAPTDPRNLSSPLLRAASTISAARASTIV
jgi:hypothetical protein